MNKKGLSTIVVTVLILLVSVAAVMLLWGFVRPLIEGAGVGDGTQCLTTTMKLDSATCVANAGGGYNVTTSYTSTAGTPAKLKLMVSDATGTISAETVESATIPSQLGTASYTFTNISAANKPVSVALGTFVSNNEGVATSCGEPITRAVTCP